MKNTKLILVLSVCLFTVGCSSTIKRVQNNIQHKKNLENIVQRFTYKYEGQCRKEAYQYYPVAMVTTTQTKNKPTNYYKSPKTATCTSMGNQVTCRDTTIDLSPMVDAYGGYGKTTTSTYDANASGRNGYVKSCVQDALKQDDSFISAVRYEKNRHSKAQNKVNNSQTYKRSITNNGELKLSHASYATGRLVCYYGEYQEEYVPERPTCPKTMRFKP
ncbi:hypothetical protein NLG07_03890 [Alteromonas sp. LMIT006]|uniref:hypothetical protein n=1 Tax=Alteromonadaceae TaxID=72275 RepID=UPI0020CA6A14|nr:hypothetical protein [Alteromonas sp. LMIT006]UTP73393.1 hypothetical protein NLG07_03890 [Alteromonas sp. LMIT006]